MAEINLGATFSKFANARARLAFEIQFQNIQNNLIRRFNDKVDKIGGSTTSKNEITRLQKESTKLSAALPTLEAYRNGLLGSASVLEDIQALVVNLDSTLDSNGDSNVDAAEVAAYIALRDDLAAKIGDLFLFVHLDIIDGNSVKRLKDEAANLAAQTPVVGALTDAANVAVTDFNADLNNKVDIALSSTILTISTTLDLEQKIAADFAIRDARVIELVTVETFRDNAELDKLRAELATILKVISLTFEANTSFAELLTDSLSQKRPEPGSILNLFT